VKTCIQGGYVVRFDKAHHEILEGGCVVFEDSTITFVGFPDDPACPSSDHTIYAPGRLISPGLINLHCIANIDLQPLRIDVDSAGFPRSKAWFDSDTDIWDAAGFQTSARFSVAALLRHGNTTFCNVTTMASKRYHDPEVEPKALAEAALELGARAYLAHNFQDHSRFLDEAGNTVVVPDVMVGQEGLKAATDFIEWLERLDSERVQGFLFPYTTETCSDELLKAASDAARSLGVTLRSHFAQYPAESQRWLAEHGISPVERLARLGILGPEVTLTHAIYLRGHPEIGGNLTDDLRLLVESGTSVAHCPVVFSRRGKILYSFERYQAAGLNLALGTDTVPPDLIREMHMASTLAKVADNDPLAASAASVYHAATIGGARALGRDDLGRLAAGAKADISIFNLQALHIGVVDDPIKALVHYASGTDTEMVIVDGHIVVESGRVIGVSEAELLAEGQHAWSHYKAGLVARDPKGRSADELYPSSLPIKKEIA
jgi:cytosine/adenosine deaminase-related metal-dependent hydrolase